MRLPATLQNRWSYAIALAIAAAPWTFVAININGMETPFYSMLLLPLVAAGMASILWPEYDRNPAMLAMSASLVTAVTILCAGFIFTALMVLSGQEGMSDSSTSSLMMALSFITFPFIIWIFASFFTLGLPYLTAILVALLFREEMSWGGQSGY